MRTVSRSNKQSVLPLTLRFHQGRLLYRETVLISWKMSRRPALKYYQPTCDDLAAKTRECPTYSEHERCRARLFSSKVISKVLSYIVERFFRWIMTRQLLPELTREQQLQSYELRTSLIGDCYRNTTNPLTIICSTFVFRQWVNEWVYWRICIAEIFTVIF